MIRLIEHETWPETGTGQHHGIVALALHLQAALSRLRGDDPIAIHRMIKQRGHGQCGVV